MDDEDVYGTFVGKEPLLPASRPDALSGCDRRWLMVGILSVLSCLNEAICFSYAPIANIAETRWAQQAHSSNLIAVYFITYIPCSFLGSWFMDRRGLRQGVLLGGFLQAVGSSLRYVACFMSPRAEAHVTFLGQIIASTAMPFMVNSPPVLSANWFPPSMRASPTSVMVNANAMGVALVYLIGPLVVHFPHDVQRWNLAIAVASIASWLVACCCFRSHPPPAVAGGKRGSTSRIQLQEDYNWNRWIQAFQHPGFWHTVMVF